MLGMTSYFIYNGEYTLFSKHYNIDKFSKKWTWFIRKKEQFAQKFRTNRRIVFNWNHFEMRLLNLRINFLFIADFLSWSWYFFFLSCFFFHYVSAKFHLWPSSGDLPRPRIGMMSLVTVSPVITAFHSCCLSEVAVKSPEEGQMCVLWIYTRMYT